MSQVLFDDPADKEDGVVRGEEGGEEELSSGGLQHGPCGERGRGTFVGSGVLRVRMWPKEEGGIAVYERWPFVFFVREIIGRL